MREDVADDQRVMGGEAPGERLLERGDLFAQLALGQLGQHLGIAGAGDQGLEHRPPRGAEHVGGHERQLHARVFEHLVQTVGLALAL